MEDLPWNLPCLRAFDREVFGEHLRHTGDVALGEVEREYVEERVISKLVDAVVNCKQQQQR